MLLQDVLFLFIKYNSGTFTTISYYLINLYGSLSNVITPTLSNWLLILCNYVNMLIFNINLISVVTAVTHTVSL